MKSALTLDSKEGRTMVFDDQVNNLFFDKPYIWLPIWNDVETTTLVNNNVPSTGALLLNYLKHCNCKQVSIIGFDWKETPTYYNIKQYGKVSREYIKGGGKDTNEPHNYKVEKEQISKLINQENWKLY